MNTDEPTDAAHPSPPATGGPLRRALEASRFLVALGAITAVLLAGLTYVWSIVKVVKFVDLLLDGTSADDQALVKLFETVDVILIATVLLVIGLGLWELFVSDLDLPPALTTTSFDDLKAKIATTLVLVLVVDWMDWEVD